MTTIKNIIIVVNLLLFLWLFNSSIYSKEELLKNEDVVFFALAPVDPRSLMQGDYMRLRYAIMNGVNLEDIWQTGYLVFQLDENNVAQLERFENKKPEIGKNKQFIKYRLGRQFRFSARKGILIGAESYFFQEGKAELFDQAMYGGLKIDKNGESLLIGLYDEKFMKIE